MTAKEFFSKLWIMLKSNWGTKLIALFFAFVIWSYVMAGTNPTRTKTVDNVPLTVVNAAELRAKNLIINPLETEIPETVSVTVEAGIDSHKSITADTLKTTLNLADISEDGKVTVQLSCSPSTAGTTVKSISPSEIVVSVDSLISRSVPVLATLEGEARDDYYVGTPTLASDYVTISGAQSAVERITKAVCYVNIENLTENIRESYPLKLYDADGSEVSSELIVENMPSAIVDIEVLPKKTVPVDEQSVIDAVTNIKDGYEVTGVVIQPAVIHIAAEPDVLDGIDLVRVQSINADGADKSVMLDAAIQPLENIKYQSASMVEVLVQINEIQEEKTFRNRRIQIENLDDGLTAQITSAKYTDVTVTGGRSVVREITTGDLMPYIDLAGLKKGTHTCIVEIPQIDGISVENVKMSVAEVTVIIR